MEARIHRLKDLVVEKVRALEVAKDNKKETVRALNAEIKEIQGEIQQAMHEIEFGQDPCGQQGELFGRAPK